MADLYVKPFETYWECRMKRVKAVRYQAANHCNALTENTMSSTVSVLQYNKIAYLFANHPRYIRLFFYKFSHLYKYFIQIYLNLSF